MSHFDSIEIDINPCDDDDIDEQIQIYVCNTLANEIPDDKMNLVLLNLWSCTVAHARVPTGHKTEKKMRHYQDYGQGWKNVVTIHILRLHSAC